MAKDPFNLFRFRSKKQEQKELEEYTAWAFPYGSAQKEKIRVLLAALVPKEDASIAMMAFLIGKEAYWDKDEEHDENEQWDPLQEAADVLRRNGLRIHRKHLPLYLALILADSQVVERLLYPAAEELIALAERLPFK